MARPQSQALAGYFPTPPQLLSAIAARVELEETSYGQPVLFDPCAGRGEALVTLATDLLDPDHERATDPAALEVPTGAICTGIELEATRAEALAERLRHGEAHHGDALTFGFSSHPGASVLFLNPPYDHDPDYRRLEHRFLVRFTAALAPGGALFYLVPHKTLAASAEHLARHFTSVHAYRFPDPDFDAYGQVLVVAARRSEPVAANPFTRRRLQVAAEDVASLPVLPSPGEEPPAVHVELRRSSLTLHPHSVDVPALLDQVEPFADQAELVGFDRDVTEILGRPFEVALPPRATHIALALATGLLDGRILTPDDPSTGLPSILAKGTFTRDAQVVDERRDSEGRLTGEVLVQQPRLDVHVLDLTTRAFHQLALGTEPSGATSVRRFNTADLLAHYGEALAALVDAQLPALHDPGDSTQQVELPDLARTPYRMQSVLIQAALKLLAQGDNPLLLAQVGTGKSTMAVITTAALSPEHFATTTASLEAAGIDPGRLRPVQRVLILCPPHLLDSWANEIEAVLPEARIRLVRSASDLDHDADYYVLSRETAKLGSRVAGVSTTRCPECSHPLPHPDPDILARRRLTCTEEMALPDNDEAHLVRDLALTHFPHVGSKILERLVTVLAPHPAAHRIAQQRVEERREPEPLSSPPRTSALCSLYRAMLPRMDTQFDDGASWRDGFWTPFEVASRAALLLDVVPEFIAHCRATLESAISSVYSRDLPAQLEDRLEELEARHRRLRDAETPAALRREFLDEIFTELFSVATWTTRPGCGAPLHQATDTPRRYPLAQLIRRCHRHRFDLLILDEAHEYATTGSAQQLAAQRLIQLPGVPTLALTGSLMGGYASSLFALMWALSEQFRRHYEPDEKTAFVKDYGYQKLLRKVPKGGRRLPGASSYGTYTDRTDDPDDLQIRRLGEAPGVLPSFILRHLLQVALIMHKSDLDQELPPRDETPVPIHIDPDEPDEKKLLDEFNRLRRILVSKIKADRTTELAGKLWGAMSELPSYLDLASEDCGPFRIAYPESVGGGVVATGHAFPTDWLSPKERWLLATGRDELAAGRNVLVYLRHTGNAGFRHRLQRLLLEEIGEPSLYLDPNRVPTHRRERWLDEQIELGCRILLVHPKAVQTGLNNLTAFHTAIWYEGPSYDAKVTRQANGRPHRIGQTLPVKLLYPYYADTLQATAVDLVARKIGAGHQVDGISLAGALEAAGALSEEDRRHADAALAFGKALFRAAGGAAG